MSPEHAELEADWLTEELHLLYDNAHLAYKALPAGTEADKARLYLAYIIKGSESLYTHYRIAPDQSDNTQNQIEIPVHSRRRKKERGPVARFFLGDNN